MRIIKETLIFIITAIAVIFLFLPSFLPDIVPLVGWLDEGLATTILLSALKHWGLDLTSLFGGDNAQQVAQSKNDDVIVTDTKGQQTQKIRIPRAVLEQALRDYQQQELQGRR